MSITLLLLAIAAILFLSVWILELSRRKTLAQKHSDNGPEIKVFYNKELASEENLPADYSTTEQLIALQAKVNGLSKKTEMAHSRIAELEQELVSSKNSGSSGENLKLSSIEQKLGKVDNLASNSEVEIKALKEIIASQFSGTPGFRQSVSQQKEKSKDEDFVKAVAFNRHA